MRVSIILLICFIAFGCEPNLEDLKGHWHSINNKENNRYHTLDISDSLVIVNAHTLSGSEYEFAIFNEKGIMELLIYEEFGETQQTSDFIIREDKLLIENSSYKYLKSELDDCWIEDLFANLLIDIELKNCDNQSIKLDSINKKFRLSSVNIGKPKNNLDTFFEDDSIQVNDVLIEPWELQMFAMQEHERHSKFKQGILLNIDKNASIILLDSIYWNLSQVLKLSYVFETCIDEEKKEVRYQRSKRFQEFRMRL